MQIFALSLVVRARSPRGGEQKGILILNIVRSLCLFAGRGIEKGDGEGGIDSWLRRMVISEIFLDEWLFS